MHKKTFLLIVSLFLFIQVHTQDFYNLYVNNPAFIRAERILQFDILGSVQNTDITDHPVSIDINSILSPFESKSSYNLNSGFMTIGPIEYFTLSIGYSYEFEFNEQFKMLFGVGINNQFQRFTEDLIISEDEILYTNKSFAYQRLDPTIGTGMKYKNLTFGLSLKSNIYPILNWKMNFSTAYFLAKYDINIIPDLIISPQIQYDNNYSLNTGLLFEYRKIIGFGAVYQILKNKLNRDYVDYMLCGSIKLFDRIQFITYYNPFFAETYSEERGWNLFGQLRISI